jgi:hypothetical protein
MAGVYEAAVRLLQDPAFPGRSNLICHAARDLGNIFPQLFGIESIPQVKFTEVMDDLSDLWTQNGLDESDSILETEADASILKVEVTLPVEIFRQVSYLIMQHRKPALSVKERITKMVEAVAPENVGRREVLVPIAKQWVETTRWFQQHTHAGPDTPSVDEHELQTKFGTLESSITSLIAEFYEPVGVLDEILEDTNSWHN